MEIKTVLFIILAAITALFIVLFQYYHKAKRKGNLSIILSFLRFSGLFGLFLLLINPKFSKNEYTLEKTNLIVLSDNSSSVSTSQSEIRAILKKINENNSFPDRFNVEHYRFGAALNTSDSLSFKEKNTNITSSLTALNEIYANTKTAIVLLTDGNQTLGADYGFYGRQSKFPVYPIAIGDTTTYEDIRVDRVNTNKYAFLKNKYPIEIYTSYEGTGSVASTVNVLVNEKSVYKERITLSANTSAKRINTLIKANSVGIMKIKVSVSPIKNERNSINNSKVIAVEVIDEKTNIAIISNLTHPDLGALKKAIESNEQRSVRVMRPSIDLKDLEDVDVFILYQPDASFKPIYKYIQQNKASIFTITGEVIDWNFLNSIQSNYKINGGYPVQETFPVLNAAFSKFDISNFSVTDYPPLNNGAGAVKLIDGEPLLYMKLFGETMKSPLLLSLDTEKGKELVLFGENIWKWRMQSYRNDKSFDNFDEFIGKLMLYLSTTKPRNRLNIAYRSIYQGSHETGVTATYFDEAFVFDTNANLVITIKSNENSTSKEIPMLLKENMYEAGLTDLPAGLYSFKVTVKNESLSKTGNFTILDFDVEQQIQSTDYKKLGQLAQSTDGQLYFPNEVDSLFRYLGENQQFAPTQKSTKNVVSLIDFRILLAIIVIALSLEWFIRKYNGLT